MTAILALFIAKLIDISIFGAVLGWFHLRWWMALMIAFVYGVVSTVVIYSGYATKPGGAEISMFLAVAAFMIWYAVGRGVRKLSNR